MDFTLREAFALKSNARKILLCNLSSFLAGLLRAQLYMEPYESLMLADAFGSLVSLVLKNLCFLRFYPLALCVFRSVAPVVSHEFYLTAAFPGPLSAEDEIMESSILIITHSDSNIYPSV